jgi:hypothetical protein
MRHLLRSHGPINMTGQVQAFKPSGCVSAAATTASQDVTLPTGGDSIVVDNAGSDFCFVNFGGAAVVATGSPSPSFPVPAGQHRVFYCPYSVTTVAVIMNSGTGTVFFTRGDGTPI